LGSINLERHIIGGVCDDVLLKNTVMTAVRILDNVIDLNFYPTQEARNSNVTHRPIGLGLMGFQDALFKLDIPFSSHEALEFADTNMEKISYYAIEASAHLARERGAYASFKGSKWDRGIFPLDTLDVLENERGMKIEVSRTKRLDWDRLKALVKEQGMRNSNLMAIAPTATISTIVDCYPCIEPLFKNIYVKSNVSGEFTIINSYLVADLKQRGLWSKQMLDQLKYYDGDLARIASIPHKLKEKYKTAFELDPLWLVKITATRGKWIDQSQSHNVFMQGVSGAKLDQVYTTAWRWGMKTLYYLRTLGASQIEKSTLDAKEFGFTQKREYTEPVNAPAMPAIALTSDGRVPVMAMPKACGIEDPTCESCQ
jgi:ribonucleoside-diphosphate reductase alpha chain